MLFRISFLLILISFVSGCSPYPKDMHNTLENVENKLLRVGLAAYDSTSIASENRLKYDTNVVRYIATKLNARIAWVRGSQSELVTLLEDYHLDIVVGGFTSPSPFEKNITFTRPYKTDSIIVVAPYGGAVPDEIKACKVFVNSHINALYVEKKKGIPVLTREWPRTGLIAASKQNLTQMKLRTNGRLLQEENFVIGIANGENAFLIRLENIIDQYGTEE